MSEIYFNGDVEIDNYQVFELNITVYIDRYEEPNGRDINKDSWGAGKIIYKTKIELPSETEIITPDRIVALPNGGTFKPDNVIELLGDGNGDNQENGRNENNPENG